MSDRSFSIVVAVDLQNGIGANGSIPWRIPADLAHFKRLTTQAAPDKRNAVVMGRKTFESIPPQYRPLSDRRNVVLTRQERKTVSDGCATAGSLIEALDTVWSDPQVDQVFVIGGAEVYREALERSECRSIYLTRVHGTFPECDVYFPAIPDRYCLAECGPVQDYKGLKFNMERYDAK